MTNPFADPAAVAVWAAAAGQRAGTQVPSTEAMLDRAGVGEGSRVLDIGTGAGDTSLLAAARVGPSGYVLATDPSPDMIRAARKAIEAAGAGNIELRQAGAGDIEETGFDAVIGRNSLQFVPEPGPALAKLRAALKPSGRLAALVWGDRAKDPWMSIPIAGRVAAGRPAVEGDAVLIPGSLGDPEKLRALLSEAGFSSVTVEEAPVVRRFGSPEELWEALAAAAITHLALVGLDEEGRGRALAAMQRLALDRFGTEGPLEVRQISLLVSGQA